MKLNRDKLDAFSKQIFMASLEVHRAIGPGMLERVYHQCLSHELLRQGLKVVREVPVPLVYKDLVIEKNYVIDLLIEDSIILELKSVEVILPVHEAQLISYLKLADMKLGFLINFNVPLIKDGFKRFVNNF
jgi:GxxExxY protein